MALRNLLKERLQAGKPAIGVGLTLPSPALVELCAHAGFHFVRIDCEHGPMDPVTAEHMIRAAEATGITPIVRPPVNQAHEMLRLLDAGAQGVLAPRIETKADAELAARAVRFHPRGERGLAGARWSNFGTGKPLSELVGEANEAMLLLALIETGKAVENLDEILAVDGIDAVQIGPNDLSQSLGFPARPGEPIVQEHMNRIIDRTLAAGKFMAMGVRDAASARKLLDRGVLMIELTATQIFVDASRAFHRELGVE